jgi:predicted nucleotidyltransferase
MSQPADALFLDRLADSLVRLPGVEAVALGGSRAQGTDHPDSDWDVAVYYRGVFDPESVRELGWPGEISEVGGWGPVFNGGGKLTVDGRVVDIHYRDLDLVESIHEEALRGEFTTTALLFHQADLPSYVLLAELGVNRTLRGRLPEWEYPQALRLSAPGVWRARAEMTLTYAEEGHARHGRIAQCAGLISEAACHAAHAILAHRGVWATNEKHLLTAAGLRGVDQIVAGIGADPVKAAQDARTLLTAAFDAAGL